MRVDLHIHSKLSKRKSGTSIKLESVEFAFRKLAKFNVKMASFTDHNTFDYKKYIEWKSIAKNFGILLLPGIEVDVRNEKLRKKQIIILLSEHLSESELKKLEAEVLSQTIENGMSFKRFAEFLSSFETIRIPHVGKGGDNFTISELPLISYDAIEITSLTHANYLKFKTLKFKKAIVAFSDTHNWEDYPQYDNVITDIPLGVAGFDLLKKALNTDTDFTIAN